MQHEGSSPINIPGHASWSIYVWTSLKVLHQPASIQSSGARHKRRPANCCSISCLWNVTASCLATCQLTYAGTRLHSLYSSLQMDVSSLNTDYTSALVPTKTGKLSQTIALQTHHIHDVIDNIQCDLYLLLCHDNFLLPIATWSLCESSDETTYYPNMQLF